MPPPVSPPSPDRHTGPFIAVSPHDLERLRLPGVFVLIARPRGAPARILAAGEADPLCAGPGPALMAHAFALGCNEALVHFAPCPRRRRAIVEAFQRSFPPPCGQAGPPSLPPLHGEGGRERSSRTGGARGK